jgi:DNA-binding transcriptional LysR family regulator
MLPLLKQCYDSALSARSLASALKKGEVGSLRLALAQSIDPALVMPHVLELGKVFSGLELKLHRGTSGEVLDHLKSGEAELALAASLGDEWERLDSWPLFTEDFQLVVHGGHRLANASAVSLRDLKDERFVLRTYCESTAALLEVLRAEEIDTGCSHEAGAESDLIALLEAGVGVAFLPRSAKAPESLLRLMVEKFDFSRTVCLYGVAGRQRTPIASTLMKMLRANDWSHYGAPPS